LTLFEIQAIAQAKNISTGDIREALRDLTRTGDIVAADERVGNTTVIIKTFSIKKEEESMSFRA
jgi:DNA-binding GntR family transcriptional regulator